MGVLKNGNPQHKLTRAENSKGGKSKSKYKRFVQSFIRRKKCTARCPFYPCFFEPLARGVYEGKCALKQQTPIIWKKFYKMILGDEPAFNDVMREALFKIVLGDEPKEVINSGEKVHRMIYGNKERVQAEVNVFDELIKELKIKPE